MFTQQSQLLSNTLADGLTGASSQAIMQLLANCTQALQTRGPLSVNAGAGSQSPRGGVVASRPNGDTFTGTGNSGNAPAYYGRPAGLAQWNRYGGTGWNPRFFDGPSYGDIQQGAAPQYSYTGDGLYWGGDTQYGDGYLTVSLLNNSPLTQSQNYSNLYYHSQDSINNVLNNYNNADYSTNFVDNSLVNNNISNWYQQTFTDNSFNDFSTNLSTTNNSYNQTVNQFAGDNYFDNSITTNTTVNNNVVNQGDVTNLGPTYNQGPVYNNSSTYLTENKTFVTNEEGDNITLSQYVYNMVVQIFFGGGGGGRPALPPMPPVNLLLKGTGKIKLPAYTLDDTCNIIPGAQDVPIEVAIQPIRR